MSTSRQFIGWPGWRHLRLTFVFGLVLTAWFAVIYGGADYLTQRRSTRVRVHLDFETRIPFVPEMTVGYMSIYPLLWMGPFVLRRPQELRVLVKMLALATLFGGIGFLLFPAELAFDTPVVDTDWASLFALADRLNLTYNLVPSLHVALATTCVAIYTCHAGRVVTVSLWTWCAVIAASTLLTHQHHLLDVVTGFVLGLLLGHAVYPRCAATAAEPVDSSTESAEP